LKIKYIIILIIILAAAFFTNHDKSAPKTVAVDEKKIALVSIKPEVAPKIPESKAPPALEEVTKKSKKKSGQTQKEITLETEKEFLTMNIPTSFSSVKEVRYQEIYTIYQRTSFYLSEVAADRLETNKENLSKAFKGLITYFKEGSQLEQMDSALVIIQQEKPGMFEEALNDLSKKDRDIIKTILKLQSDSE
jgi:hypothetical protein